MTKISIVYHSRYGHTKQMAEAVMAGASQVPGSSLSMMTADEAASKIDELDKSDAIIFGSPTYMGNVSAGMKQFLEVAGKKWFTMAWKDKIAGAFTNSCSMSGDKLNTLMSLEVNAMQHGMIFVGMGLPPAESMSDAPEKGDIETAKDYGRRIASITGQFVKGRN